jgi:phenylacetate-CoA ligase
VRRTPLEQWIAEKVDRSSHPTPTLEAVRGYQLRKLRETIKYAGERSPFYRRHFAGFGAAGMKSFEDFSGLPFTVPEDLSDNHRQFLCVSQSEIERVVTLLVPGMSTEPRRVYFTAEDLELTIDFFHHGMSTLVQRGHKVLILLPGDRPGSVGDLLVKALHRMGGEGIVHGIVQEPATVVEAICRHDIDCLVGIPTQVLSVARHPRAQEIPSNRIKSILLSADYVPSSIVHELRRLWDCPVFNHYGTTEMGLGGGVECEALLGYHMREADLYMEIVDPDSGKLQPPGMPGEIVFTTLTRIGMPLIRYRTGDLSRFVTGPCPCGAVLPRMDKVRGRINEMVRLRTGDWLGTPDLDEALFPLPGIVNYRATLTSRHHEDSLRIEVHLRDDEHVPDQECIEDALSTLPQVRSALAQGCLRLEPVIPAARNWVTTSVAKRSILRRAESSHGVHL